MTYFILLMAIVYTTLASDIIAHVTSAYDEVCYDGCKKRGGSYYYCHTKLGWDYCSPSLNLDYYGKTCKTDHLCTKHGYKYYWCYNNAGSWGYCGPVERKLTRYTSSTLKKFCLDDCTYNARKEYFYCYTSTNGEWDYCSPVPNVSSQNEICNVDDPCGFYGGDFYWCKIGNSWDYCGLVDLEKCHGEAFGKRALLADDERQNCIDNDNFIRTTQTIANDIPPNLLRTSAYDLIGRYSNNFLTGSRRTILRNEVWRLDMQGITSVDEDGQQHYNLQLQLNNVPRKKGRRKETRRTTYASVQVPVQASTPEDNIHDAVVRDALVKSFEEKKGIKIKMEKTQRRRS